MQRKSASYLNPILLFVTILLFLFFNSCKSEKNAKTEENSTSEEKKVYDTWRIDLELVESGCERLDCIRSIDDPKFIDVNAVDFLSEEDLVIGLKIGNEVKCYPHAILNWHEIVNDELDGKKIAINYCPLTGSGMAWNREINGRLTDFGVSGMLFNSNIIPYDRTTRSAWCQMKQLCVNGELMDSTAATFPVIETTWETWKKLYPNSKVLSTETGMSRNYLEYPYDEYRENDNIYFEVQYESDTLFQKERLFGIIEGKKAKCYRFNKFKGGVRIINDTVFNKNIIVVGSERDNFMNAFENKENLKYSPINNKLPGVFKDDEGNIYDAFGKCVDGAKKGEQLNVLNGFTAYWFAWYAFYPEVGFE